MLEVELAELGTIVTYNPWTVSQQTPLSEMVRLLNEAEFQHWPVVDADQRLTGIVAEVDIVRAFEERGTAAAFLGQAEQQQAELEACCVGDIMTRRPLTVQHRASLACVLRLLDQHGIRALPVLQEDRLVGLVTTSDILREFSYGQWPAARDAVTDCMLAAADPIDWEASLEEAATALHLSGRDYVGVARADFPLGVISRRDVRVARCRATAKRLLGEPWVLPGPTTVRELVASAPTVRPGERLFEVATLLLDHGRQAAAVVNQAGRLMGVATEAAILARLTDSWLGER